mmetsp:Transcript_1143/g.4496  ORF Transcript_1143/g.4496 Transcript_1143/m.4496 type:complete len:275 (-) Transcript_1143:1405-2229(-)
MHPNAHSSGSRLGSSSKNVLMITLYRRTLMSSRVSRNTRITMSHFSHTPWSKLLGTTSAISTPVLNIVMMPSYAFRGSRQYLTTECPPHFASISTKYSIPNAPSMPYKPLSFVSSNPKTPLFHSTNTTSALKQSMAVMNLPNAFVRTNAKPRIRPNSNGPNTGPHPERCSAGLGMSPNLSCSWSTSTSNSAGASCTSSSPSSGVKISINAGRCAGDTDGISVWLLSASTNSLASTPCTNPLFCVSSSLNAWRKHAARSRSHPLAVFPACSLYTP